MNMPQFEYEPYAKIRASAYVSGSILASNITIRENGTLVIRVKSDTSGILSLIEDAADTADTGTLNANSALTTDDWFTFEIPVQKDEVINFSFSVAAAISLLVLQRRG